MNSTDKVQNWFHDFMECWNDVYPEEKLSDEMQGLIVKYFEFIFVSGYDHAMDKINKARNDLFPTPTSTIVSRARVQHVFDEISMLK